MVQHSLDASLDCEAWHYDSCHNNLFDIAVHKLYHHDRSQGLGGGICISIIFSPRKSMVLPHEFKLWITVSIKHNQMLLAELSTDLHPPFLILMSILAFPFVKIAAFDADMKIKCGNCNLSLESLCPPSG